MSQLLGSTKGACWDFLVGNVPCKACPWTWSKHLLGCTMDTHRDLLVGNIPCKGSGKGRNPKLHMAVWKQVIWLHQTILSKGKLEVLAPFLWTLIVLIEDDSKEEPFSQGITLSCFPEDNFISLKQKAMEASHPLQNSIYRIHIKPIHLNEINLSSLSL